MKVTVLIITYNHEKYIQKAIESILMQIECPGFEIILCDDKSADNTVAMANAMLADFKNVHIYPNEKNLGITKNYQQAFAKCSGEYILVLEGDDYWTDPLKIKKQTDFLDSNPDCVMCAHTFFSKKDDTDSLIPPYNAVPEKYTFFNTNDLILDPGIISNFSTCCYRKSILNKISPKTYDTISYEWMINMSVGQFGIMARINEPMSVYRVAATGAWSNKTQEEQLAGMIGIIEVYNNILENKYAATFSLKKNMLLKELQYVQQSYQDAGKYRLPDFLKSGLKKMKGLFLKPGL
jgi:glycosyltransferase involved in cell wall biosynthesis